MDDLQNCIITGLPIAEFKQCSDPKHNHKPYFQYRVSINGYEHLFRFCLDPSCIRDTKKFIEENKNLLHSLLLNGKRLLREENSYDHDFNLALHKKDFEELIANSSYPKSPQEKLENFFLGLSKESPFHGSEVMLDISNDDSQVSELCLKYFLRNDQEAVFYLRTLEDDGLVEINSGNSGFPQVYSITYKGLLKSIELQDEGIFSRRCFIAMSFDADDEIIFSDGIVPACKKYDFIPVRVDRIQTKDEQTINDLIIAELKKCKFVIADFTKHKAGVYFEAGYGLGRGKKVIYTCNKKYFSDLHFDVNHFPVIIYESAQELREKLGIKIEAYILD